jgi:predicted PurR-regulated permease PerM
MTVASIDPTKHQKNTVVVLTVAISAVFIFVIRGFLMALLLASVFAGVAGPFHQKVLRALGGRQNLAALATLIILVLAVVLPILVLVGIVAAQAYELTQSALPWFQANFTDPEAARFELPEWFPFRERILESSTQIASKIGELAGKAGGFLISSLSAATAGTAAFLLSLFVMLYAMFFFFKDGTAIRDKILHYLPLPDETKLRLIDKGLSVTRATIKGTLVIGLVQGFLGGLAFAVVGIQGAAFWGTVMAVSSVIPGIGTALVWVPAVVYLLATGQIWYGIGLAAWCACVVGTIDNILRPSLVGKDTQMPDLLILVSTLGGLAAFGAVGLIIGPMIAALFVTMWDIFGTTFGDVLSEAETAEA